MDKIIELNKYIKDDVETVDDNFILSEGDMCWRCECGSILFFLTPNGAKCKKCGVISNDWAE